MWDPHRQKQIVDIEGVQRRTARFVRRCYNRTPGSVTRPLNEPLSLSLEQRRKGARLTLMYQAVNGKIALQIPDYVKPKQRITRQYHHMKFTLLTITSNTHKFSFYARTIPQWNSLPAGVIDQLSVEAFRVSLITF